jgi:hypothetical protein
MNSHALQMTLRACIQSLLLIRPAGNVGEASAQEAVVFSSLICRTDTSCVFNSGPEQVGSSIQEGVHVRGCSLLHVASASFDENLFPVAKIINQYPEKKGKRKNGFKSSPAARSSYMYTYM